MTILSTVLVIDDEVRSQESLRRSLNACILQQQNGLAHMGTEFRSDLH